MTLTVARLREVLDYDPNSGEFRWRIAVSRRVHIGGCAGSLREDGRVRIHVDGRTYRRSRLAWLWMTGEWPKGLVDHKDRDCGNDKWGNLREASCADNARNVKNCGNKTGKRGVKLVTTTGKFTAQIRAGKAPHHLGTFETAEAAAAAYDHAARTHHGEFAVTNGDL